MLASLVATACLTTTQNGGELVDSGTDGDADDDVSSETDGHTGPSGSDESGGAPSCADTPSPSCGDGIIDALEECEGTMDCDACSATLMPMTTVDVVVELIPYAVATDGSSFGMGIGNPPDISMRRYDADGELSWADIPEFGGGVGDVAIDTSGNVYVAGSSEEIVPQDGTPWLLALDGDGLDRWSVTLPSVGSFYAVALAGDRVAVAGFDAADTEDNGAIARVQVYDTSGVEQWTVVDPTALWIDDIAFVGADVAAIGTGPGLLDQIDDTKLVRYDENGTQRWSVALPDDGLPGTRPFGVIADDAEGTWSFGQAAGGP